MKIAILGSRGIPAAYGGFERFAEELAVRLTARGIDVTVYCEDCGGDAPATYKGVRLEYVPVPRLGPLTTILFDLRSLWKSRKDYDVVYMLGYGAGAFCFLPRLWGTTVWINMDGIEWARSKWGRVARIWFRFMEMLSVHAPDRVIADAEAICDHLSQRHPAMKPCSVIPYGAPVLTVPTDAAALAEWGLAPDRYDLVVCRLEPENMVAEIVDGYSRSNTPVPLVIVGDHRKENGYVRSLASRGSGRIRFIGTVYDAEKLKALRYHARCYIHGHQVGGTNPSLLEAMGCGNIVVASDNRFNREVAGPTAFYFHGAHDLPRVLAAIGQLGPERIGALKGSMQKRIRDHYTWESVVDKYYGLLPGAREATVPSAVVAVRSAAAGLVAAKIPMGRSV